MNAIKFRLVNKIILILMMVMVSHIGSFAQSSFCGVSNTSFKSGEYLKFRVYYNMSAIWVAAGEATFTANTQDYNGKPAMHVVGEGRTLKSYEWFFKVRDKYESYIEPNSMLPLRFLRDVNEGKVSFKNDVSFYHPSKKAVSTNGTFTIPECTQDILSAIYYARSIDYNKYKPGDKIPFSLFLDDEVHNLYIRYVKKEKITTKYGTFNTIKIAPLLIEGTIFKGGEKMAVWVSDDANRVPVRIESPILVGNIVVDLVGYKNLRNPFTGLISIKK